VTELGHHAQVVPDGDVLGAWLVDRLVAALLGPAGST
jgi:hypothetical protein